MRTDRQTFGANAEAHAEAFFRARGFEIISRNWTCRAGELDLVVAREGRVHFVEVKARTHTATQHALEAITKTKRHRLERAIDVWREAHAFYQAYDYQVDAFCVWLEHGRWQTAWIEGM